MLIKSGRTRGISAAATALRAFEAMLDRLQLSNDQKTQVKQIVDETRRQLDSLRKESEPRFTAIRQQADERMQKVLSPEQWKQFQQERESMRGRRRGRGRDGNRQ